MKTYRVVVNESNVRDDLQGVHLSMVMSCTISIEYNTELKIIHSNELKLDEILIEIKHEKLILSKSKRTQKRESERNRFLCDKVARHQILVIRS